MTGTRVYDDIKKLSNDNESLQELVIKYTPFVKRIVYHMICRMPSGIQSDDLVQTAMIGLIEAARKFDAEKGASFETYASIRIRGKILDEFRKIGWVPRSVHKNVRRINEAIRKIESETGRDAQEQDIIKALDMTSNEYHAILKDSNAVRILGFDEAGLHDDVLSANFSSHMPEPDADVQRDDLKQQLAEAIGSLPEREGMVLSLYYDEELNLKEIGEILGVSESRICQIHSQAIVRLKSRLTTWEG